jgi:DedD protein
MAKSISEEELQLRKRARRRLIGAIALVIIVAVFLPLVLDHEPRSVSQDVSVQMPPAPDARPATAKPAPVAPAPVKTDAARSSESAAASAPPAPSTAPGPVVDSEAAPDPAPAATETAPKAQTKPDAAPASPEHAPAATGYVVQVAALSDTAKARQIQKQIAATGLKSYTEVVPTKNGNVTRVRAGPFASRESAEKARDRLKKLGLNASVVAKTADKPKDRA